MPAQCFFGHVTSRVLCLSLPQADGQHFVAALATGELDMMGFAPFRLHIALKAVLGNCL